MLDTLPEDSFADARMASLADHAAREALSSVARPAFTRLPLPVMLSVPAHRPGWSAEDALRFARTFMTGLPVPVDKRQSGIVETGHDGGLEALGSAIEALQSGRAEMCLVGGVESFKDIDTLHWLESYDRLLQDDRPNGFIPGEGAAFILVCTAECAYRHRFTPVARVLGLSHAIEPNPWYMGKSSIGQGLTSAFRAVLTDDGPKAAVTYCDLNGESWRADEWSLAYIRNGERFEDPLNMHHPADRWGDVGAATGALLLALSAFEFARRPDGAPTALVWAASDTRPVRSACLLERAERRAA